MTTNPEHRRLPTTGEKPSPGRSTGIMLVIVVLLAVSALGFCGEDLFHSIQGVRNNLGKALPEIARNYRAFNLFRLRLERVNTLARGIRAGLTDEPTLLHAAGNAFEDELAKLIKETEENELADQISQLDVILERYKTLNHHLLEEYDRLNRAFNRLAASDRDIRGKLLRGTGPFGNREGTSSALIELDYAMLLARRGIFEMSAELIDPGLQPGRPADSTRSRLLAAREMLRLPRGSKTGKDIRSAFEHMNKEAEEIAAAIRKVVSIQEDLRLTTAPLTRAVNAFDKSIPGQVMKLQEENSGRLTRAAHISIALLVFLAAALLFIQTVHIIRGRSRRGQEKHLGRLVATLHEERDRLEEKVHRLESEKQRITEEGETWRDLFENASDLIQILAPDGRFLQTNKAWHRALGYTREDLEDLKIFDIIHPNCRGHCMKVFSTIGSGDLLINTTLVAKDGRKVDVEGHANLRMEDGRPISTRCILRDVTAQHKIENEAAKAVRLEGLALMTGGIGHDFNNLLTTISGNLSLINAYGGENKKIAAKVEQSEKAIERAREMVNRLMDFSRVEEPRKRPLNLTPVLHESAEIIASNKDCNLVWDLPEILPKVNADPGQIGQVIQNLVNNAAQAMAGGKIEIGARTCRVGPNGVDVPILPGEYLEISVRDFGPGLDQDNLEHIFEPYFTTRESGHGLGLAVSYSILRKHQGLLTAGNHPEGGAIFHLYLPLTTGPEGEENE